MLTLEDADAFDYRVKDEGRDFPIVVISCGPDGSPLVDPARLSGLLLGVAEVVVIPPEVDTYRLQERLGEQYSAYGGAVTMIWRRTQSGTRNVVPSTKFVPAHLIDLKARSSSLEAELFASVCHRTNAMMNRTAITLDEVKRLESQRDLALALRRGGAQEEELKGLYQTVDVEQRAKIESLTADLARRDDEIAQLRDTIDELESAKMSLKQHLDASGASRPAPAARQPNLQLLLRCATDDINLVQCLEVIQELYPDRVVVLDSAIASAREASKFKHSRRALDLLIKLCGPFWSQLSEGKGTIDAKAILSDAYAANESETVRGRRKARELRTFDYAGQPVEMMSHLRIGTKDSLVETWRCHFHWDAASRRIVIGHCGRHLDHK
jgi:hypothetical protein